MTQLSGIQRPRSAESGLSPANLPDELFARLLGGTVRLGAFAGEARGAPRVVINRRSVLHRCGGSMPEQGPPEACTVRDLSVSGVGLLVEARVEPGQAFVLVLRDPRGIPAALPCVVVRQRSAGPDSRRFVVGARFIKDMPRGTPAPSAPVASRPVAAPRPVSAPAVVAAAQPSPTPAPPPPPPPPPAASQAAQSTAEVERIRAAMFNG